ncbi:MAG: ABC transporter ATP-binding protein [Balneolales bacterium]|nr:ABC transporter ATP-binding protein [Balneolales bacterium]
MISITKLEKKFGRLNVLRGIDLDIHPNEVTAVLGPNGAGKTTFIKSLLGLVKPDSGSISIRGKAINGDAEYRSRIGYMPQSARYPDNLSVHEILEMVKDIRGATDDTDEELFHAFNLKTELPKKFKTLSGGNRQKVSAVLAFLFKPDILFLDEPSAGLDPVSSSCLKDKIAREKEAGKTIILTSHIMSEIQELADKVVYILDGVIHFETTVGSLLESTGEPTLERAIARKMKGAA